MIKGINISKSFGTKKILKEINIEILKGKITVVMGESGSGKTTLLRMLSLLDKPDSGKIIIDGDEFVFEKNKKTIKPYPKITVVYQQLFLWPHLTNRENITLAINDTNYLKQFNELVVDLKMSEFIDNYPNQSSVGQKQRVAIARAIILNPEYILFDEITASIDEKQIESIMKIMKNLKNKNIGIFFITHQKYIAEEIGDVILDINEL